MKFMNLNLRKYNRRSGHNTADVDCSGSFAPAAVDLLTPTLSHVDASGRLRRRRRVCERDVCRADIPQRGGVSWMVAGALLEQRSCSVPTCVVSRCTAAAARPCLHTTVPDLEMLVLLPQHPAVAAAAAADGAVPCAPARFVISDYPRARALPSFRLTHPRVRCPT